MKPEGKREAQPDIWVNPEKRGCVNGGATMQAMSLSSQGYPVVSKKPVRREIPPIQEICVLYG